MNDSMTHSFVSFLNQSVLLNDSVELMTYSYTATCLVHKLLFILKYNQLI